MNISQVDKKETQLAYSVIPNGVAIAAYMSVGLSLLGFGIVVVMCEVSEGFKQFIHALGKAWIPGAQGIGPYSGKETALLLIWLISWTILHFSLGKRELNGTFWLFVFVLCVGIATILIWPPAWHIIVPAH